MKIMLQTISLYKFFIASVSSVICSWKNEHTSSQDAHFSMPTVGNVSCLAAVIQITALGFLATSLIQQKCKLSFKSIDDTARAKIERKDTVVREM